MITEKIGQQLGGTPLNKEIQTKNKPPAIVNLYHNRLSQVIDLIKNKNLKDAVSYLDTHFPPTLVNKLHGQVYHVEKEAGHETELSDFGRVAFRKSDGNDMSDANRIAAIERMQELLPKLFSDQLNSSKPDIPNLDSFPTSSQWNKLGTHPHHGIALSLGALRGEAGSGTGEFLDLIPMIQWCQSIGFDSIQLLPINDSGGNASPYSLRSSLALHPIYLSLSDLPSIALFPELSSDLKKIQEKNSASRINYKEILRTKEAFLKKYVSHINPSPDFTTFVDENPWVEQYALYKTLKEVNERKPWWKWEESLQNPTSSTLETLKTTYKEELHFHTYVQFLCFDQWKKVKDTAESKGIKLVGDVPILVDRDSCDVWTNKESFSFEHTAGAPPDMMNADGQNWGLPLYNWQVMQEAGYPWWKERLKVAGTLYHTLRVDNILSFFQFWAVPPNTKANEGFFLPADEELALAQGKKNLHMLIANSQILPIGEGMGKTPKVFKKTLKDLGISSIKILRWKQNTPSTFNPLSLACVSTHDTETLKQWWKTHHLDAELLAYSRGWDCPQELTPEIHKRILKECHAASSLFRINLLQEYLGVFPELSPENPDEDRINVPGYILDTNWTNRFRPTIQQITAHEPLRKLMQELSANTASL